MATRVGIIGAGIGGLVAAQALRPLVAAGRVTCAIYERDHSPNERDQGYAVGITETSKIALRNSSLFAGCPALPLLMENVGAQWKAFAMMDTRARVLCEMSAPDGAGVRVDRVALHAALLAGIDIKWGKKFVRYEEGPSGGGVTIHFADGSTAECDVLIAADGANSVVRKQRAPALTYNDLGYTNVAGSARMTDESTPELVRRLTCDYGLIRFLGPKGHTLMMFGYEEPASAPAAASKVLLWSFSYPGCKADWETQFGAGLTEAAKADEFGVTPSGRAPLLAASMDRLRECGFPPDVIAALGNTPCTPDRLWGPRQIYSVLPASVPSQLEHGPTGVYLMGDASHGTTTHMGMGEEGGDKDDDDDDDDDDD